MESPKNQIEMMVVIPDNILVAYNEPHRFYHNLDHLHYMINRLMVFFPYLTKEQIDAIIWALYYHDIVYHIPRLEEASNEQLSAQAFERDHGDHSLVDAISAAIVFTETHILPPESERMTYGSPRHFWTIIEHVIDLDLWALSDEPAYLINNERIKTEVGATDEQWREGRGAWLVNFLQRDQIYYTEIGKTREAEARRILEADLKALRG